MGEGEDSVCDWEVILGRVALVCVCACGPVCDLEVFAVCAVLALRACEFAICFLCYGVYESMCTCVVVQ